MKRPKPTKADAQRLLDPAKASKASRRVPSAELVAAGETIDLPQRPFGEAEHTVVKGSATKAGKRLSKRDLQKIKTRRLILQAGRELFAVAGLSLPTVEDVAKAASISRQAFYMHFKSRDDLLLKVFDREVRWQMRNYRSLELRDKPDVIVLRAWVQNVTRGFAEQRQYIAIMRRALAADATLLRHIFQERRRFILRMGKRCPVFRLYEVSGTVDEGRVAEMTLMLLELEYISEHSAFGAWDESLAVAIEHVVERFMAFGRQDGSSR